MTKDYYKILDINEGCSQDEIKSAYRRLARKWHPDIAGNSADVITKFKEINEAYEILSNLSKKADYDTARRFYNYAKNEYKTSQSAEKKQTAYKNTTRPDFKETESKSKSTFNIKWEELFFNKKKGNDSKSAPQRGKDINADVEISVFEAIEGCSKVINMLQTQVCQKCSGRKFVNGNLCSHCKGKGETSVHKKFTIKIPAGIKDKSKIRLAGEGEKGLFGGANGDMYITVHIAEPVSYKTDGLNILKTIQIAPYEAVLGTVLSVSTLSGNVSVKISPNTKNGQKIKLNGCGITKDNQHGDMIITLEIQISKNLTNEEIELYKRLKEISSANVRDNIL